jgi:hypothetical protein
VGVVLVGVEIVLGVAKDEGESVETGGATGAPVPSNCTWGVALGPLVRGFCFLLFLNGPTCSDEV